MLIERRTYSQRMLPPCSNFEAHEIAHRRATPGAEVTAASPFHLILETPSGELRDVALPPSMMERLAAYVRHGPAREPFDCESFVYHLNGGAYHYKTEQWSRDWEIFRIPAHRVRDSHAIPSGATVLLANTRPTGSDTSITPHHFAVHLADGIFLSKLGDRGPLAAANLENLRQGYGGEELLLLKPRF